ncbi:MAG TPA: molybdenum cofactor biosynthesis protein MoaE [Actinomycetales bacterium]|jgi:molybdopterin synthase catalytic subunit
MSSASGRRGDIGADDGASDTSGVDNSGADDGAGGGRPVVRLTDVRESPLSVDEVVAAVADPAAGGTCVFIGAVREQDDDRAVSALAYSAHPTAVDLLAQVAALVAGRHELTALAAVHRVGDLVVGDLAVVVAVSAPHRAEAFTAARDLIDTLKSTVPIWKHQQFDDGGDEWVGLP